MNKREFVDRRKPTWIQFERLVRRAERIRLKRLDPKQASEFSTLLREVSGDLALVRSRGWGEDLGDYLNHLTARGHNAFYRAPPPEWEKVLHFLTAGFPRLFRKNVWYFAAAAALFFVPLIVTWGAVQTHPDLAARILPRRQLQQFEQMYDHDADDPDRPLFSERRATAGGFYVRHNVGIALRVFAGGILLGAVTIYVLLSNGIGLGGTAGYLIAMGHAESFTSFVISHGSFELTAIAISGGAGLMLGHALVHPGRRTRLEALRSRGMEAVALAVGAGGMLVIAAAIEAFWSPSGVPSILKYVVGTILWIVVYAYLFLAGRGA